MTSARFDLQASASPAFMIPCFALFGSLFGACLGGILDLEWKVLMQVIGM
jgi:hypothetical protein